MRYQRAAQPLKLDGPEVASALFNVCFAESDPARECLWVAQVDSGWNCIHLLQYHGDTSGVHFPFRAILAEAISCGSDGVILAHNHPSGDPRPSISDCLVTRRLACAASGIGCVVIDHFVFAGTDWVSFRRLGLL